MVLERVEPVVDERHRSEDQLEIGHVELGTGAHEPARFGDVRREHAAPAGEEPPEVADRLGRRERHRLLRVHDLHHREVVLQVLPDAGQIRHDGDARTQASWSAGPIPDNMRSCGELIAPPDTMTSFRRLPLRPAVDDVLDAGRARAVEDDPPGVRPGDDREVAPLLRRLEVRVGRAPATTALLRDLRRVDAVLVRTVDVLRAGDAGVLGRLEERDGRGVRVAQVGDVQRPAGAAPGRGAALGAFGALEVGEDVAVRPSLVPRSSQWS